MERRDREKQKRRVFGSFDPSHPKQTLPGKVILASKDSTDYQNNSVNPVKETIDYKSVIDDNRWIFSFDWKELDHHSFVRSQELKIEKIKNIIKSANIIFDVGANVGIYSTFFRHFYPESKIYAFEPIKPTSEVLKLNTKPYDINVFNHALWDSNGKLDLALPKGKAKQSTNFGAYWKRKISKITVDIKTLDSVCEDLGVYPDFLKIDVEGGESHVLGGYGKNITKTKYIMVEYRHVKRHSRQPDFTNVHHFLLKNGFRISTCPCCKMDIGTLDDFDKIYVNTKL